MSERLETQIAIIGGGVTGLCAAGLIAETRGADAVLVLEASGEPGGTTRTEAMDGFLLDWGPNGFLNREPKTIEWVDRLGLRDDLVFANDNAARRFILKDGRLQEVIPPPKFLLTSLLSVRGRARLACEPLIPAKRDNAPESIHDFAARRIGREAAETLVGPMVTGIFGGDARQLSLEHCFPRMAEMERQYGGLVKALVAKRRTNKAVSPIGPAGVLTTLRGGIGALPRAAAQRLGARMRTGAAVTRIDRTSGSYQLTLGDGVIVDAEKIIVAGPAYAAARMLEELDHALAAALASVAYADMLVLCTAYRRDRVRHDLNGFGFLVPRREQIRSLGCLWTSSLFPTQAPAGYVLLRTMYGGATDPSGAALSDTEALACFNREISPLLGIDGEPEFMRTFRHQPAIPQYLLGHGRVLEAVDAAEARWPGLVFAGNAYRGVGLNDCVLSAHRAAEKVGM